MNQHILSVYGVKLEAEDAGAILPLNFNHIESRLPVPADESGPSSSNRSGSGRSKSHTCAKCGQKTHNKSKEFLCRECDFAFALKKHADSMSGENSAFSQQEYLKFTADLKNSKLNKFPCSECNGAFARRSDLKRHLDAVHRKLRNFPCIDCERAFTRQADLKRHIESVHWKMRKYVCGECNRAFAEQSKLKSHLSSVHKKFKKFACGECDSSFSDKKNLVIHLRLSHQIY